MFKNILLCICLLGSSFSILNANENTNYSVAVELARAKKVDFMLEKINELNNTFKLYVYNTGDINANISKINNWNGNLNLISWENYDKDQLIFSHNQRNSVFGKLFSNEPSKEVMAFLLNSSNVTPLSTIDQVNFSLTIPHDSKFMSFYKYTEELSNNNNVVISDNPPADKTKIWYKPDGNGGYEIFAWSESEGKWISYGKIGFDNNGSGNSGNNIVVKSIDELNSIPATSGLKAYVSEGGIATEYIYDGEKWVKAGSESTGGSFNGDSTILDLATSLMSKAGGSIATVSDAFQTGNKNNFSGVKDFTKKDNSSTNGYWINDDNKDYIIIVGSTMADITTQNWTNGTTAYLPKANKLSVDVLKRINNNWYYIADGYVDVVQNMNEAKKYLVWDKKNNEYFKYNTMDYWYSITVFGVKNDQTELTSNLNGRAIFLATPSVLKYLTLNNDCNSSNCNGDETNNYYAGDKRDGMFVYYYSANSPKRKNNLTDSKQYNNLNDLYNSGDEAGIVDGVVYLKDTINEAICYKDTTGYYYTKSNIKIPTSLNLPKGNILPTSKNCTNATYNITSDTNGMGRYLNLNDRSEAINWDIIPNEDDVTVRIDNKNFTYVFSSGLDYWTDGLSMASTTEMFTKGSRKHFPNVTKPIIALTGIPGDENRYTLDGVQSSIDANFKQWFYSNSGTAIATNNLLDGIPCLGAGQRGCNNAESVGHGITSNGDYIEFKGLNTAYGEMKTWVYPNGNVLNYVSNAQGLSISNVISSIGGKAGNGLFYTNDSAPFNTTYTPQSQFGVTTHSNENDSINPRMNNTNICAIRGMRLPLLSETAGTSNPWGGLTYVPSGGSMGTASGVPSHPSGYTWTSTAFTNYTTGYWIWNSSSTGHNYYYGSYYVRCVR